VNEPISEEPAALRLAVVGVGAMGSVHAKNLAEGKVSGARLSAICDIDPNALERFDGVERFATLDALLEAGVADALVVATPHYDHPTSAIRGLESGLSVLVEKPLAVHKADAERILHAYERRPRRNQLFGEMFNQRTDPRYITLKGLIDGGKLGELRRVNWIITNWFRTEAYYRSGGWRATWAGEGGGVLLNQSPHQIDLWQWLFGMPARVRAFCGFGRFHDIEVEDQVTAYFEYESGATGVFVTTTGESPGTNRLEVAGDLGKVVVEDGGLRFYRNEESVAAFGRSSSEFYAGPKVEEQAFSFEGAGPQHLGVLQNFVDAVRTASPLIAPAVEGIRSVELANAMLFSSLEDRTVELPLDARAYETKLRELISKSKKGRGSTP
jgi:predicted dehydrogenase